MLDPDALAQGACMLQRATVSDANLIIVSRFGNAEADGPGLLPQVHGVRLGLSPGRQEQGKGQAMLHRSILLAPGSIATSAE